MTSKKITSEEIIFIHQIIRDKFGLPKGHIKRGELETILATAEGVPFSTEEQNVFRQAAIILEGIIRIHIFTDGNKRTALESTRQFLNRNNHVLIVPLSGTNFIYKIAQDETQDTEKVILEITGWLTVHSPKVEEWHKIMGLMAIYVAIPMSLVRFFSKIKLASVSRWILRRYIISSDPNVTNFMISIYEKQFELFKESDKIHDKQKSISK